MQNTESIPTISQLIEFIEQKKNEELKSLISSIDRSQLINAGGNSLMHAAAATSNIQIIVYLSAAGFDIDARDARGQTPLHLAIANRKFQAMQILLSLDPNILITDSHGLSALQLCFKKENKVPEHMIVLFLERLERRNLPARLMAGLLVKVGCSIHQALGINKAEVIGFMLDRKDSTSSDESRALLERAMSLDYPENVRVLLERGVRSKERLEVFFEKGGGKKNMKCYFEKFIDWDVVTKDLSLRAQNAFRHGDAGEMQVYLDVGIDEYARKKFGWELLAGLFGNKKVDGIEIVKTRKFDANRLDMSGTSALHKAVVCKNKAGIIYLLENGADPNIKDSIGRTPLFVCHVDKLTELLLNAGADLQIADLRSWVIFGENSSIWTLGIFYILKERGSVERELAHAIWFSELLLRTPRRGNSGFEAYRQDLKWMKTRELSRSVSLFDVIADKVENTARHVRSEDDVAAIMEVSRERKLQKIYESMLRNKLERACKVSELRPKAAAFLCNVMKIGQMDHLVIENIIGFLNYRDLLVFDIIDIEIM